MRILKILFLVVLLIAPNALYASNQLDVRGISEHQKAEIALQIAKIREQNPTSIQNVTPEKVAKYVDIGVG